MTDCFPEVKSSRERACLLKPEPQYTEEARRNQITAQSMLRVVFASSGEVVQIRAVRTLAVWTDGTSDCRCAADQVCAGDEKRTAGVGVYAAGVQLQSVLNEGWPSVATPGAISPLEWHEATATK